MSKIRGIVIDAGHGGDDPGAIGNDIIEKNLTLEITKELEKQLKKYNIPIYLTRVTDETLPPNERTKRILNAFGDNKDVIVISNHINAGGGDGAEVIYALRNTSKLSDLILAELELAGQNIRKAYQKRSFSDPSKDYYFIHRDTGNTEPVIIEYGFLDSKSDDIMQLKYDYKKYAEAVAKAVAKYVGIEVASDNYIVKAGDTLWSIAKSNNMTVDELKQINNLKTNLLSIGQELIVKKPEIETNNKNIYIVEKGDTLYSIGRKYNISVNKIIEDNNLSTTKLSIGQKLYINDNLYTVKAGDTLYSIARKYNTTVENLMKINNLSTTVLSIGQILKI